MGKRALLSTTPLSQRKERFRHFKKKGVSIPWLLWEVTSNALLLFREGPKTGWQTMRQRPMSDSCTLCCEKQPRGQRNMCSSAWQCLEVKHTYTQAHKRAHTHEHTQAYTHTWNTHTRNLQLSTPRFLDPRVWCIISNIIKEWVRKDRELISYSSVAYSAHPHAGNYYWFYTDNYPPGVLLSWGLAVWSSVTSKWDSEGSHAAEGVTHTHKADKNTLYFVKV